MKPQLVKKHAERVKRNEFIIKFLGLIYSKEDSGLVLSLSVRQGNVSLFHRWSDENTEESKYDLHLELESFLKRYVEYLFNFDKKIRATYEDILK